MIYVNFTISDGDGDEIYPKEIVKDVRFYNMDLHEETSLEIYATLKEDYFISFVIDVVNMEYTCLFDQSNKFTTRRDAKKFLEMLHKLYEMENPNNMVKYMSKINDTELEKVQPSYEDNEHLFWSFITINFGSWEGFMKKLDHRDLWDYPPVEESKKTKKGKKKD